MAWFADLDQPGRRIASVSGFAYNLRWLKTMTKPKWQRSRMAPRRWMPFPMERVDAIAGFRGLLHGITDTQIVAG